MVLGNTSFDLPRQVPIPPAPYSPPTKNCPMAPSTPGPAQANTDRKMKTVFQLDTPFTTVQWPKISPEKQDTILELLCTLLSPVGQYRSNHITPSKGKREKKRKRREAKLGKEIGSSTVDVPPLPQISRFISVGLNSVSRGLEALSQISKPEKSTTPSKQDCDGGDLDQGRDEKELEILEETFKPVENSSVTTAGYQDTQVLFSAVFVARSSQPSILHAHLPQLIATASLAHPECPATRLVQLPKGSEERLCEALGIPRVSFIGLLEGAPLSTSLVQLIRAYVPEVDVPWLKEVKKAKYLPVKINSIQTLAPVVVKKGQT